MSEAVAEPSAARPAALWEDFVDIFFAPAAVFARRERSGALWALIVYVVLTVGGFLVARPLMQPVFDHAAAEAAAKLRRDQPQITNEQIAASIALQEKFTTGALGGALGAIGQLVWITAVAVAIWLAAKPFGSRAAFGPAFMVATYSFIPRIVGAFAGIALLFVTPPERLTTMESVGFSPARFVGSDVSPVLRALLGRFDLFTLWTTVLLGVGIAVVGRIPRGRGLQAAALVWALATAGAVLNAYRATL
ncbi:hypothetical protein tb265_34880 [Gemmatimonadetes bacterium T265]|nr:hypothetical protein tb265_34880 [Gemmatimonadetes bacterium T265]